MNSDKNYSFFVKNHKFILDGFKNKHVILLFSGGKDSSTALDFLLKSKDEFGFDLKVYAGAFPVHRYPEAEKEKIGNYWKNRGCSVVWLDSGKTDNFIDKAENPCLLCQQIRKQMLKGMLADTIKNWNKLVIVAGYSLWDIVSYSVEHLLSGIYSETNGITDENVKKRSIETSQRFYPLLKMKEGYSIFRPMVKFNNNDIKRIIDQENIPIISIGCKYKDFRPKRILDNYFIKTNMNFDYDKVYDFAVKSLGIPDVSAYTSIDKEEYLVNIF